MSQENQNRVVNQSFFFIDTPPTHTSLLGFFPWGLILCIDRLPRRGEILLCKNIKENFNLLRNAGLLFCFRTLNVYNEIIADFFYHDRNEKNLQTREKGCEDIVL